MPRALVHQLPPMPQSLTQVGQVAFLACCWNSAPKS